MACPAALGTRNTSLWRPLLFAAASAVLLLASCLPGALARASILRTSSPRSLSAITAPARQDGDGDDAELDETTATREEAGVAQPRLANRQLRNVKRAGTGNVVTYELNVTYGYWAPDCVNKQVYLVNGQFPGPTLRATEGDTMKVVVRNKLHMEGLSIHWHGIDQRGTNLMDGAAFVTQCPITPQDYKVYTFTVHEAGTYMYHGHHDDQVVGGIYGSLIVDEIDPSTFPEHDGEINILLSDWWHRSAYEQSAGLDSNPFYWVGEAQSLLINGAGKYDCALIPASTTLPVVGDVKSCDAASPQCARKVFTVEKDKTYRVRIASIANLQSINVAFEGHTFTVVAADGSAVQPFVVGAEGLDVYSGQTYDVLLTADQASGNYWIRGGVFARNPKTPFALAVLQYSDATAGDPTTPAPAIRAYNDHAAALAQALKYKAGEGVPPVPLVQRVGRRIRLVILVGAQQRVEGYFRWAINNISLVQHPVPYAIGIAKGLSAMYGPAPPSRVAKPWDYSAPAPFEAKLGSGYYTFRLGQVVDFVLQNTNNLGPGSSEYHPWHMHGHNFWVLGYGNGAFDPDTDFVQYNLVDPPLRNTVTVLPYGWVAIRFIADNPGAWLFHCHISMHLHMGMAIVFVDGRTQRLPSGTPTCGLHTNGYP